MMTVFKREAFRETFTFSNNPEAVWRFPFPFDQDNYAYSVDIGPHTAGPRGSATEFAIDIDEHYVSETRERYLVLQEQSPKVNGGRPRFEFLRPAVRVNSPPETRLVVT
jgi:hypothetical protein